MDGWGRRIRDMDEGGEKDVRDGWRWGEGEKG